MASGSWRTKTVSECLVPVSVAGKGKIQTRDYKPSGRFPIIDQGQDAIAGWTDDESAVIDAPLPLIVFGDHTRAFKFAERPFARGADGTQLLCPKTGIDPLFFFYACRSIDLEGRGYNRHFSILKEREISYPEDENEQRSLGRVLRHTDLSMKQQDSAIESTLSLKNAAMRELFTRGLRGEAQKDSEIGPIPESWRLPTLGTLGKIGNGTTPNRKNIAYWQGGTLPWITSGRMYERNISGSDVHVTPAALKDHSLPLLKPGAVLIAIVGQGKTLGHCALLEVDATVSRHVGFIQPNEKSILPRYLISFLESQYTYLRQLASGNGSTRGALTCSILRSLQVPLPTLDEQAEIAEILEAIDRKIDLHKRKRAVLEELFRTLLHKLMTGEVDVNDLDLSAIPATNA